MRRSAADDRDVPIETLLQELGVALGIAWMESMRDALRRDGRAVEGGWPGTMAEARARVLQRLRPELARRALPFPDHESIARASAEVYAVARRAWLAKAVSTHGEDD